MDESMCLISKVKCKESSTRPIILSFENGQLNAGQECNVSCRLYKRKHSSVLAAATKSMIYSGKVKRNETHTVFIGLVDKNTNKTSLIALDEARLSPWFKESRTADVSIEDKALSVGELNKVFGSKRVKRQTEQLQRMKLDVNNVKEQLEQTVADITVDVRDMVAPSVESYDKNGDYKPKINRDAATVEEIYKLDELVSLPILNSASEELERILQSEEESWGTSEFIKRQIQSFQKREPADKEEMCQLLLYIDCLIKFMLVPAKTIAYKKYVACAYSDVVHRDIVQKFTVTTGNARSRPNIMRDKCLCYILVLSILACRNTLNLDYFSKELKLGLKKLQDVSRVLGFTVLKEVAHLKLPLPAPVTTFSRSKKKKVS